MKVKMCFIADSDKKRVTDGLKLKVQIENEEIQLKNVINFTTLLGIIRP